MYVKLWFKRVCRARWGMFSRGLIATSRFTTLNIRQSLMSVLLFCKDPPSHCVLTLDILWCLLMVHLAARLHVFGLILGVWYRSECVGPIQLRRTRALGGPMPGALVV